MTRFPSKGMRAMRAEFPKAERIVQVRIIMKDGSHMCIEGPVTTDEARAIVQAALGQSTRPLSGAELADKHGFKPHGRDPLTGGVLQSTEGHKEGNG